MQKERPYVICISGFDPCGGAGILADIKTLEMHRVQGQGVCTSLTFQNEHSFAGLEWVSEENILTQLQVLLECYRPKAVKIGIIQSLPVLQKVVNQIKKSNPNVFIIWDPVLKASAGFNFHDKFNTVLFRNLLKDINLLTPNIPECRQLFATTDTNKITEQTECSVLLKGGHSYSELSTDVLIHQGKEYTFSHKRETGFSKHGTGCILSSAVAANVALGFSMKDSCRLAKDYIQTIITSNNTRLAYHYES